MDGWLKDGQVELLIDGSVLKETEPTGLDDQEKGGNTEASRRTLAWLSGFGMNRMV